MVRLPLNLGTPEASDELLRLCGGAEVQADERTPHNSSGAYSADCSAYSTDAPSPPKKQPRASKLPPAIAEVPAPAGKRSKRQQK
jgi:hypothetical protein